MAYRRLDFECEILLIMNYEFYTRCSQKVSQKKEYAMNNVTCDHNPFVRVLACNPKHARLIDITHAQSTCMYVHIAVDHQE